LVVTNITQREVRPEKNPSAFFDLIVGGTLITDNDFNRITKWNKSPPEHFFYYHSVPDISSASISRRVFSREI
jgi:hypothetical protein